MSLLGLTYVYKNEELSVEAFKEYRLNKGVVCKKCGSQQHYWLMSKQQFQCVDCRFRTTLRSGTVLQGSKLPYSYFFIAVNLLTKQGNRLTLDDFQKHTGHKYYEPLWEFLNKLKINLDEKERTLILSTYSDVLGKRFHSGLITDNVLPLKPEFELVSVQELEHVAAR
ncbi:MAG: transposase [Chitinophagaceae bacterium]|nr:transposase [Chitinophagaceae bacterium]